jgi:hypothetical protein
MVVEALVGAYLGFIAFMMSAWMIDDSLAFRLTERGWTWIAVQRVALWSVVGLACWLIIVGVNRFAMPRVGLKARRSSFWLGLAVALAIVGASIAGAIRFVERTTDGGQVHVALPHENSVNGKVGAAP